MCIIRWCKLGGNVDPGDDGDHDGGLPGDTVGFYLNGDGDLAFKLDNITSEVELAGSADIKVTFNKQLNNVDYNSVSVAEFSEGYENKTPVDVNLNTLSFPDTNIGTRLYYALQFYKDESRCSQDLITAGLLPNKLTITIDEHVQDYKVDTSAFVN